jgi:hypothetical protein
MSELLQNLEARLHDAVREFWEHYKDQAKTQGSETGRSKDRGGRNLATAGAYLSGFHRLIAKILEHAGLKEATICWRQRTELPGWFRAEKNWDLLVVVEGRLIAVVEFKSQVGSFGNNFNNRTEEALGNALDLWTAFEAGAFAPSERPWLGCFTIVEDAPWSKNPARVKVPYFPITEEFRDASYAKRYELLLLRLLRRRLYDAGCFLMSTRDGGLQGDYREPNPELSFRNFVVPLTARALAIAQTQGPGPAEPPRIEVGPPVEPSGEES